MTQPQPALVSSVPARRKPASSRTAALPAISKLSELEEHLATRFSPPEWKDRFFLTPGELCDVAENYPDQLTVGWKVEDGRLSAEKDVIVSLGWSASSDLVPIVVVGLYVFPNPREAQSVWVDKGVYGKSLPVERVLGIRGRCAVNFQSGSYCYSPGEMASIRADELWPRIWEYCQSASVPIEQ